MKNNKNKIKYLLSLSTLGIMLSFSSNIYAASPVGSVAEDMATSFYVEGLNDVVDASTDKISESVKKENRKEKQNEIEKTKPGTAREQGYVSEEDKEKAIAAKNLAEQMNSPRQQGIQVDVAYEGNPVLKDHKNKMYVKNWAYILQDVGVTQEKTYYEAGRLNKEDFEDWANGIYNAIKNSK